MPRPADIVRVLPRVLRRVVALALCALPCNPTTAAAQSAGGGSGSVHPPTAAAEPAPASRKPPRAPSPGALVGHGGPIKALAVDARSGLAISGSFDYALMVWNVADETPHLISRLADHGGAVNAVAFARRAPGDAAPDRALAAGDDGHLTVWSLQDRTRAIHLAGHTAKIVGLAVAPDGRTAATASWDRTARLWDLAAGSAGPVLEGHTAPVNAVAFSADGALVYTAGADGQIRQFRTSDGSLVRPVHRHGWGINTLVRLPGSEHLAFGTLNGDAAVLDPASGTVIATLASAQRPILALAVIEKPGLLAVSGGDGVIRVHRLADLSPLEDTQNPYGPVWALAFRPDGTGLYHGGLDDAATLWRITPRAPFEAVDAEFPRRFQVTGRTEDPVAEGEVQFARKCSVCHTLEPDGRNRAGPTLSGIFGRRIATLPGYPFSEPLKRLDIVWTEETVARLFELGPDVFTPGSKMPLQKMTDSRQRNALIAYMKAAGGAPRAPAPATPAGSAPVDVGPPLRQGSPINGEPR